jgi:hypothetical protein
MRDGRKKSKQGCILLEVVIFFTPEVYQNDANVCRDRYWVEFLPVEDRDGADAPVEDAV